MFCDEHGTADYCPDCVSEPLIKEIAELKEIIQHLREDADRLRRELDDCMGIIR